MLHHAFWADGRLELAAELRLRQAKFGATPEDRARLGGEIAVRGGGPLVTVEEGPAAQVADLDQRRKRLTDSRRPNRPLARGPERQEPDPAVG